MDAQYLKQTVGDVLQRACTWVAVQRPADPIEALGLYLQAEASKDQAVIDERAAATATELESKKAAAAEERAAAAAAAAAEAAAASGGEASEANTAAQPEADSKGDDAAQGTITFEEVQDDPADIAEQEQAAIKIQARVRGIRARRQSAELRAGKEAEADVVTQPGPAESAEPTVEEPAEEAAEGETQEEGTQETQAPADPEQPSEPKDEDEPPKFKAKAEVKAAKFDELEQTINEVVREIFRDKERLEETWKQIDGNGNGRVSLAEVDLYVQTSYPLLNHKPALMRAYKKTVEKSEDGFLHRPHLVHLLRNLFYFNRAWHVFDSMDADADHRIDVAEFCAGVDKLGMRMEEDDAKVEFGKLDGNAGGVILFDEFCVWLADKRSPFG